MIKLKSRKYKDLVYNAYRKLKQDVYYDNSNLFLRSRLARFEEEENLEEKFAEIESLIKELDSHLKTIPSKIEEWIGHIQFKCLPKKVKLDLEENNKEQYNNLIHNVRSSKKYCIDSVDYFIEASIELLILDVIWTIIVGDKIDKEFDEFCLGYRLHRDDKNNHKKETSQLFKMFHNQYALWRDTAIKKAKMALENETDILIVGLDLKQCYYHLETDWEKIITQFTGDDLAINLCKIIQKIQDSYYGKIKNHLDKTHITAQKIKGLPIGLVSSRILCNFTLSCFDKEVEEKLHPLYYGRYVDDMILVLQQSFHPTDLEFNSIIDKLFKENKIARNNESQKDLYYLDCLPGLPPKKCSIFNESPKKV